MRAGARSKGRAADERPVFLGRGRGTRSTSYAADPNYLLEIYGKYGDLLEKYRKYGDLLEMYRKYGDLLEIYGKYMVIYGCYTIWL